MAIERQFRVSEAAEILGLREATLRKWILLRRIGYRKVGGAVRVPESEIRKLLDGTYVPTRAQAG
jgi:excisionase family DNA binding protein